MPAGDTTARRELAALGALVLLPWIVFLRPALLQTVFFAYDVQHYFYPYHALSASLLRGGEMPLWNPYALSGIPLLADGQLALFFPPSWLFFFLPPAAALNYAVLVPFSVAGAGMYLFLRSLGLRQAPALLGAVAYMFCGHMSTRIVILSILNGAALLPLVFLGVHRAVESRRRAWFAAAALAIAAQALGGHPQVPVYTLLALALYGVVRGVERGRESGGWRPMLQPPAIVAGSVLFGYCLAAVQLAPWAELAAESVRAAGASFDFVFQMSMSRHGALQQIFPFLYGTLQPGLYGQRAAEPALALRMWEHSAYIGVLPLGLAVYAALGLGGPARATSRTSLRTSLPVFFVLLVVFSLAVAAGSALPVSEIVYRIPVLGRLRQVARVLVLADFALAALAAYGLQRIMERRPSELGTSRRTLLVISVATFLLPAAVVAFAPAAWFQRMLRLPAAAVTSLAIDRPNAMIPLALAAASAALLACWSRREATRLTRTLAAGLVLLDLGAFAASFTPTADASFFGRRPGSLSALRVEPGAFRKATFLPEIYVDDELAREALAVSWGMVFGVEDVNGFNSLQTRRYADFLFGRDAGDVSYGEMKAARLLRPESPILSQLNAKFLFVPAGFTPQIGPGFKLVYENRHVRVFENTLAYPRAYFAEKVAGAARPADVLAAVTADGFDGRRLALVETRPVPALPPPGPNDGVAMKHWSAHAITVETSTASARLLVLSEMYFPGWRAFVDGVETTIYRTNYLFRGVVVPPGRHLVTFKYLPRSVLFGAALSFIAAVAAAALIVTGRARSGGHRGDSA